MRVLIVNNFVRQGSGTDTSVRIERRALSQRGHEVQVFGRDNHVLDNTRGLERAALLASCLYSLPVRNDLSRRLRERPVDVVLIHNLVPLLTGSVYDACRETPAVTVQRLHNFRAYCLSSYAYRDGRHCDLCTRTAFTACAAYRCYRESFLQSSMLTAARWFDWARGRATGYEPHAFLANSEFTKLRHEEYGLPADRIRVVPNSAEDLAALVPDAHRTGQSPAKKLTYVGSLIEFKGAWTVIDLAAHLPEFEVHLLGSGRDEQALRSAVDRRRLGNVVFHGLASGPTKAALWADSFLTLFPSLVEESFGLVAPESYSLSIPVVTTGTGAIAEAVTDGVTGYVRDFRSPADVAALVRDLWSDHDRYRALREAARSRYDSRYTVDMFARSLEDALCGIVAESAGTVAPPTKGVRSPRHLTAERAQTTLRSTRRPATSAPTTGRKPWHHPASLDLRVLIDGHMIGARETGNETYVRGLLEGLETLGLPQTVVVRDRNVDVGHHTAVLLRHHSDWARVFVGLPALARRTNASVVHCTYITPPYMPCARVVTVHDLSFMRHPGMFTWRDRALLETGVPLAVRSADMIIVPSNHSRDDLLDIFDKPPERVRVTYEAVSDRFRPVPQDEATAVLKRHGIDRPYVLTVGSLQPRKNPQRLLAAWAELAATRATEDCLLVLAGGSRGRTDNLHLLIEELHLGKDVLLTGYIPDADLPAIYSGARAFVFPSLHEGFGLPVLEAMACGVPVGCSSVTSLPEVAGDAAALFDPYDVDDMAATVGALVGDETLRASLRERGFARAHQFSWEQCARETLGVYADAAAYRKGV